MHHILRSIVHDSAPNYVLIILLWEHFIHYSVDDAVFCGARDGVDGGYAGEGREAEERGESVGAQHDGGGGCVVMVYLGRCKGSLGTW